MAIDINMAYQELWQVLLEPGRVVKSGTYDYTLYEIFVDDFLRFENRHGFVTYKAYLESLGFVRPVAGRQVFVDSREQLQLFIDTIQGSLAEVEAINAQIQMNEQFDFGDSVQMFNNLATQVLAEIAQEQGEL
jgi:hypothetical protein